LTSTTVNIIVRTRPAAGAVLELLKPVTWFPPMWAFACGVVSSGIAPSGRVGAVALGVALTGPLVCGASQAVNDWYDRHVDAINEPDRPIPSGRIPGRWGLGLAVGWSALSLTVAAVLGWWVWGATLVALVLAWAYSAPPLRLKANGWLGNAAVGFTYEGLAWVTGAALMLGGAAPGLPIVVLAVCYSLGAHGIMTLNDFKAMEGDRRMGIASLPVQLGADRAAVVACATMLLPQVVVVLALLLWGLPAFAGCIGVLMLIQGAMMRRFVADPVANALWYSAAGVPVFVSGMMVAAVAVRGGIAG
jgi:chlorophyll/bacteriochlorophyll a synthase